MWIVFMLMFIYIIPTLLITVPLHSELVVIDRIVFVDD